VTAEGTPRDTTGPGRRAVLGGAAAVAAGLVGLGLGPAAGSAHATQATRAATTPGRKVLIIGIDGLRWDLAEQAGASSLLSLASGGVLAPSLLYTSPMARTDSGPGWATMLTGVWPDQHKTVDNSFAASDFTTHPGLLSRLRTAAPELSSYAAVTWGPLDSTGLATKGATAKFFPGDDPAKYDTAVADAAEKALAGQNHDVSFVYFGNVDIVGHNIGTGPEYLAAVKTVDGYVSRLLKAVKGRAGYPNEQWLILVSCDHGHANGGGHGGTSIEERRNSIVANGTGFAAGTRLDRSRLTDLAPTVLHHLGVNTAGQNFDGDPLQALPDDTFNSAAGSLRTRVDETDVPAGLKGFTHTAPAGWSIDNSKMGTGGVTEWRGWSFTTDEFWTRAAGGQNRELNVRARGVFAVADPDEWADKPTQGTFDSTLLSPSWTVAAGTTRTLHFVSHYRHYAGQVADVQVSWNGGTPQTAKTYTGDAYARREALPLKVPAGATSARVGFRMRGDNTWFWAVDAVRLARPELTRPDLT
jgi:hypothetical protein